MTIIFQSSKGKSKIVYKVESYRNLNNKPRYRIIEKLGLLDDYRVKYEGKTDKEILKILKDIHLSEDKVYLDVNLSNLNSNIISKINYGNLLINTHFDSFNLNTILKQEYYDTLRNHVTLRIISPGSKLKTFKDIEDDNYLGYKNSQSLSNIYYLLEVLSKHKNDIIKMVNSHIKNRDLSYSYYDTTNFYFEVPFTSGYDIRQNGFSKENRPNPIIQMGLLTDANHIPLTYKLFKGNTKDSKTLKPILDEYSKLYSLNKVIIVADAGINENYNLDYLKINNGYIVRQHISSKTPKLFKDLLKDDDFIIDSNGNKIKEHILTREVEYYDESGSKIKTKLTEKIVITFTMKYYLRDMYEKAIKKERILNSLQSYESLAKSKYARYFKVKKIDKSTNKETSNIIDTYIFDESLLDLEYKYSGYCSIITSETNMTKEEILSKYKGLVKIEDLFKIDKHILETRPVHVRVQDRIEGHFLICYIALVILTLMVKKLSIIKPNITAYNIQEELKSAELVTEGSGILGIIKQSDLFKQILKVYNLDTILNKERIKEEILRKLLK